MDNRAESSATMWIDPENELIIIMTPQEAGENFETHHRQFIKAIVNGMIDPAGSAGD